MNIFQWVSDRLAAISLTHRLLRALEQGKQDDALTLAPALQRLVPDDPRANFLLAQSLINAGQHEEALGPLNHTLQYWPDDAPAWYALGVCHDYLDDSHSAIIAYKRTLSIAPHWAIALKHLGRCAWRSGDTSLASRALKSYCQEVPDDKEAHDLLGYIAYEQGRMRDASSHYSKASYLDPQNPQLDRNARLLYRRSATS